MNGLDTGACGESLGELQKAVIIPSRFPSKLNYEVYLASSSNDMLKLVYVSETSDIYSFQLEVKGDLRNLRHYQDQLIIVMDTGVYSLSLGFNQKLKEKSKFSQNPN